MALLLLNASKTQTEAQGSSPTGCLVPAGSGCQPAAGRGAIGAARGQSERHVQAERPQPRRAANPEGTAVPEVRGCTPGAGLVGRSPPLLQVSQQAKPPFIFSLSPQLASAPAAAPSTESACSGLCEQSHGEELFHGVIFHQPQLYRAKQSRACELPRAAAQYRILHLQPS